MSHSEFVTVICNYARLHGLADPAGVSIRDTAGEVLRVPITRRAVQAARAEEEAELAEEQWAPSHLQAAILEALRRWDYGRQGRCTKEGLAAAARVSAIFTRGRSMRELLDRHEVERDDARGYYLPKPSK